METLASHQLTDQELEMMRSAASLGQKETRRQAVKRAFKLEKAGIQAPSSLEDSRLVRQRRTVVAQDDDDIDSKEKEEDEEMDGVLKDNGREETMPDAASSRPQKQQQQEQPAKHKKIAPPTSKDSLRHTVQAIKHDIGLLGPTSDHVKAKFNNSSSNKPPRVVHIIRSSEMEAVRTNLPIIGMEQEVMEAVSENDIVVLCGQTGCGKTTQVPQFLLEAGYGCRDFKERAGGIAVTQPRRVAAVATARRVAEELGVDLGGSTVGYTVRHDVKLGEHTAIKFMTDGVLLREVQEDFLLKKYSVVVVDEAHERSLNTDILLGLLSRVVRLRRTLADEREEERDERMKDHNNDNDNDNNDGDGDEVYPLKLIIMSATLRTEDFIGNETLFASKPPLVSVPARQYPVTVHFSKKTEMEDYVGVAAKKVEQIHNQLPPGGILVFLTGHREVDRMCRQVKQSLTPKMKGKKKKTEESKQEEEKVEELDVIGMDDGGGDAAEALDFNSRQQQDGGPLHNNTNDDKDDYELMEDVEDEDEVEIIGGQGFTADQIATAEKEFEKRLGINLSSLAAAGTKKSITTTSYDDDNIPNNNEGGAGSNSHGIIGVHVLPLYAALQPSAQAKVFQPTPPGHRLIIVATNVAETSLTIPGIRYVVDAGRSKQRLLESSSSGLARFDVRWISKASAEQRAGRAGRTGPGHCYRLFSSAVFNDMFPQHTPPEIKNTSLEGVALSLKSLGVDKVVNFPFPTPPEQAALKAAENCLVALGALHPQSLVLTALGKQMAAFPIGPRHARMLLAASKSSLSSSGSQSKADKRGLLPYAIALAAVMSVDSPFLSSMSSNDNDGTKEEDDGDDDERQEEERRNTQAKKAQQAQGQFRLADSDALSALYALCAFETQGGGEAWCRKHHLHYRNLKEASALRRQLTRTVTASLSSLQPTTNNNDINTTLPPPSTAVLVALRHALTAGWCDSVARRVRSIDHINKKKSTGTADRENNNNGRMRAIRYRSAILEDEDIYLHPNSNLSSTAPEYVVYTELIRTTKRPYMAGVTAIEPQWLVHAVSAQQQQQEGIWGVVGSSNTTASTIYLSPLCQLGPPLSDPPPTYLPNKDQVVCWREVRYGKHDWLLPHYVALHPDVKERCALFAAALLEGKILPGMKRLKTALAMAASSCVKPEMRAHWRVAELLGALDRGGGVDSKAALREKWRHDPAFLRKELLSWMQKGTEAALLRMWESLKQEAMQ
jgi:ATP-dependent RNA helicase DHX37/DHR1